MLGTLFKELGSFLDRRFFLTVWVPCQVFWLALLAVGVGGYGVREASAWWGRLAAEEQVALLVASLGCGTILAYLLAARLDRLMRIYEGYWDDVPILSQLLPRQRAYYEDVLTRLDAGGDRTYPEIYDDFPPPDRSDLVLPTRLGNVMRSAEVYPGIRYNLDGVLAWPRLYVVLPESLTKAIASVRSDMDLMLVLSALGAGFAALGGLIAVVCLPWYASACVFWAGAALFWLGYLGLVGSARAYGQLFKAAFDVHRGTLLKAMGWEAPASWEEERRRWEQVTKLWYRCTPDVPADLGYPPAKPPKEGDGTPAESPPFTVVLNVTISRDAE
jgi:hypothetical protein